MQKIALAIILGAIIIGAFIYLGLSKKSNPSPSPIPATVVEDQSQTAPSPSPIIPSPSSSPDDSALIKEAIIKKLGINPSEVNVTVSDLRSKWAKGSVGGSGGGGYFISAKQNGSWIIVFDGQSTPPCATIAPYDFPTDMVPECLNSSGTVVKR